MIGNGSSNIVLTFLNVSEPYENVQTKISKNQHFVYKKWQKLLIFCTQNAYFSKFWFKHARMLLIHQEKLEQCQNFHFLSYNPLISRIWDYTTLHIRKLTFLHLSTHVFYTHVVNNVIEVLTKRSTLVDQNVRSCRRRSQLSVAIFIAPRTHLVAQKSLIQ